MSVDQPAGPASRDLLPLHEPDRPAIVESVPQQLVVPLDGDEAAELQAAALTTAMHQERFDLRRRLFLAFVIDFADRRDGAYEAARSVTDTDWESTLYGDSSGWVVRLSRTRRINRSSLLGDISEVKELAERAGGRLRSMTVEDLRAQDRWAEMADQLRERRLRPDDTVGTSIPLPRAPHSWEVAVGEHVSTPFLTP